MSLGIASSPDASRDVPHAGILKESAVPSIHRLRSPDVKDRLTEISPSNQPLR